MKSSPSRKFKEFRQGVFRPHNKDKCLNKDEIYYRSHLEFRMMHICDKNPNVVRWGSENVVIPYINPVKSAEKGYNVNSRYFMDFYLEVRMHDGRIDKILAEVKPEKQTKPPTKGKNKKISTLLYENTVYAVNIAKWEAAKKYCQKNGYLFYIINEKDLEKLEKI